MSHELSITVERDGQHFIESSVEPGKVLEGPFSTQEEADRRAVERSREFAEPQSSVMPEPQFTEPELAEPVEIEIGGAILELPAGASEDAVKKG